MFAALGPRGCAPLGTPAGGAPLHRTPWKRLRRPCRGPLAEGQGCRGKSAPDTLPAGLGRSGRVKGPCPRPYGAAGRTNPLTRPLLEKRARGPRRGLWGHCRSGWGSRLAQRPRSGLALTPRNDPNAPGWWLGVLFPQPPATWRTPPEGRRRRSRSALASRGFGETPKRALSSEGLALALALSTANGVCVSAPLLHFGDWY